MTEDDELRAKIRNLRSRVQRATAARDATTNQEPRHHPYGSVRRLHPSIENHQQGIIKRGGSTMKWISRERNEAKLEGRRRYESKVHSNQKERVLEYFGDKQPMSTEGKYFITLNGVNFGMTRGGSKLVRLGDSSLARLTPKEATINGVQFKRSKNGNLIRASAIQKGSSTGKTKTELCKRYTSTGSCSRGAKCSGIHDPVKIAICPSILRGSECAAGDECDLSHSLTPEIAPTCTHFLRGRCTKEPCLYSHATIDPSAPICRDFAYTGYCVQGQNCGRRHLRECPDYADGGRCRTRSCVLPHVDRASQMRKRLTNKSPDSMDVDGDLSSEEESYDDIDSDDVDSDDLQESPEQILGANATEFTEQDFIGLT